MYAGLENLGRNWCELRLAATCAVVLATWWSSCAGPGQLLCVSLLELLGIGSSLSEGRLTLVTGLEGTPLGRSSCQGEQVGFVTPQGNARAG